jgi:malonyl CoA-acyl carrier protein transacylase
MNERPAAAVIGLNACTADGGDLHDVWSRALDVRSAAARPAAVRSVEEMIYALVSGAWADAFGAANPRRVTTFFTTAGDAPVGEDVARRVMYRLGGQLAEAPSSDPAVEVLERAVAVAAGDPEMAVIAVVADANGHGTAIILDAPARAARRAAPPYAIVECSDTPEGLRVRESGDAVAIVETILAVAYATIPPPPRGRMRPWFGDRVATAGERLTVRQWRAEVANRLASPPARTLFRMDEPLFLSAGSREELLQFLREGRASSSPGPVRLAIVAATREKVAETERALAAGRVPGRRNGIYFTEAAPETPRPLAFLFPGQGAQYPGMLAELCCHFPAVREWFERLDRNDAAGRVSRWVFDPPADNRDREEIDRRIMDPETGGHAGFVASLALYELLGALGLDAAGLVGYSNGENTTLLLSGAIHVPDREDIFELMREVRGHAYDADAAGRLPKGITVAITGTTRERVEEVVGRYPERAFISMDNCPSQVIVFAAREVAEEVTAALRSDGAVCLTLPFDRAYHTPLFRSRSVQIEKYYETLDFRTPFRPIYSCATAAPFPDDPASIRAIAALQWRVCVQFRATIERLYADGIHDFIEVGGAARLTGYTRDILRTLPHEATPTDMEGRSGLLQLQHVAAHAFVAGWNVDISMFRREEPEPVRVRHARLDATARTAPRRRTRRQRAIAAPRASRPSPPTGDIPTYILASHFALMDEFLESQQRVLAAVLHRGAQPAPLPAVDPEWPFLGRILRCDGEQLEALRTLSPDVDGALHDHTLGRPALEGHVALPVVPFSIGMEMMAEAAAAIAGEGFVVTALRDVRAHRWVAADDGTAHVRIISTRTRGTDDAVEVEVALFSVPDDSGTHSGERAFEAVVELRPQHETSPHTIPARSAVPESELLFNAHEFYDHCMFHGPLFQMIRRVRRADAAGIEAELDVPRQDTLVDSVPEPRLRLPALLLDGAGQLIGYWLVEHHHQFFGEFPFHIGSVTLHRAVQPGERLVCRATLRHDGTTSAGTFELAGENEGTVAVRITDFTSRHYAFERDFLSALYWPGPLAYVSTDLDLGAGIAARFIGSLTSDLLTSSHAIWSRALAHMMLGDEERAQFYAMPANPRRAEWLLGRLAAKEAVRSWASAQLGMHIDPLEMAITSDDRGAPFVVCPRLDGIGLHISITHSGMRAAAAAATTPVGIDYEPAGRRIPAEAFSDEERGLWPDGDLLPLWCAREAAAKASGRALEGAWRAWRIAAVSDDRSRIDVEHEGITYAVRLGLRNEQVFALCVREP